MQSTIDNHPLDEEQSNTDDKNNQEKQLRLQDLKGVFRKVEGCLEIIFLSVVYYAIWRSTYRTDDMSSFYGNWKVVLILIYAFLLFLVFYMCDSFKYGHRKLSEVIVSQWISVIIVDFITYFQLCLINTRLLSPLPMLLILFLDGIIALLCSIVFARIYHNIYVPKNMVMIFGNEKAVDLKFKMDERPDKYCVTKVVPYTVGFERLREEIAGHDAVVINDVPAQVRNDLLKYCYTNQVRTYVVPKISDIIVRGGEEISLFDTPLYLVKGRGLNLAQSFFKRALDIVLCIIALIPGLPIMGIVALAIKLDDHGPVFYRQKRVTKNGRAFDILKFRSMVVNADKITVNLASESDPRITKVGRVIRTLRLDELPQILNILKGDMSWVGPRPEQVSYTEEFIKEMPEYALRTKVKGGLTGYAQIYGKYNTSPYDKARLDLMYIENYSLFLDIKLIFMTVQIMFKKESTEGIDVAEQREQMREQLLEEEVAATVERNRI